MGKGIFIIIVGTLLFVAVKQNASSETQFQASELKVEYQEDVIAQEIAMSAYSIAERRAQLIGGPADSIVAALNGYYAGLPNPNGYTSGSFQDGTYEISATRVGSDLVTLHAKGMFGDAERFVEKSFIAVNIPETDWDYGCSSVAGPNHVEIQGIGMGDDGTLLNNGATINLADTTTIHFIKAQVGGRTINIDDVRFVTNTGEDTTLTTPNATGSYNLGYFETPLETTSSVMVDVDVPSTNGARGFVVYAHRRLPTPAFSSGRYLDIRMIHAGHTEVFEIPASSGPRTIFVDFVMYDKDDDGRTVTLTVEANGDTATNIISMPNMDRELSIETLALNNVPGGVTTVNVSIYTNDSLYWKMAHVYTTQCN